MFSGMTRVQHEVGTRAVAGGRVLYVATSACETRGETRLLPAPSGAGEARVSLYFPCGSGVCFTLAPVVLNEPMRAPLYVNQRAEKTNC